MPTRVWVAAVQQVSLGNRDGPQLGCFAGQVGVLACLRWCAWRSGSPSALMCGVAHTDTLAPCLSPAHPTGDGDTHLAFLPCFTVVELMRQGLSPREAAEEAVRRMARHRPGYVGAVVAAARDGRHGAAAYGWSFAYSVVSPATGAQVQVVQVPPLQLVDGPGRHGVPRV